MRLVLAIFAVLALNAPATAQNQPPGVIVVTGEGRGDSVPDMATLRLGVVSEGRIAGDAIDANSAAMADVMERLTALGIEERDLQTSSFSVSPRYPRDSSGLRNTINGYVVRNILTVRIRDLGGLGEVLDAVAEDGANSFDGLSFGLQDPGPVLDAARRDAVAEARRKAMLYAEAAGVTLGPLLSLTEAGAAPPPVPMMRAEMAMASDFVPVAGGEVSVSASVTLTYAIAE